MVPPIKRITINDIARMCGVAKSTVSEVINGDPKSRVKPATFEKVQKVIAECGYTPMQQARAMSSGQTRHIGLLISSSAMLGFANSYFSLILAGVEHACSQRHYYCTVSLYDLTTLEEFVMPPALKSRSIDALIVAGELGIENSHAEEMLGSLGIPVAVLGYCRDKRFLRITRESVYGAALDYLGGLGHRNLLLPFFNVFELEAGQKEIEEFNRRNDFAINGIFTDDWKTIGDLPRGQELCNAVWLSKRFSGCTALIANDQICSGFLQQMLRLGKRCPDDFSILSGENTPTCEWNSIPISACGGNIFDYGDTAANLLIDLLERKSTLSSGTVRLPLPEKPVIRETTGAAPC